ncbi:MAG: hypothetical protein HOL91_02960 [Actinobacteria bacterium]|nr:hypothetical protein [Actinomycetota bacterium]
MTRVEPTWAFREIFFSRDSDREETRQFLTLRADRGRWELDRTKIYRDGRKKVRLRRKVYRVEKAM